MIQFIISIVRDACELTMGYCVAGLVFGNPRAIGWTLWMLCHPAHWFHRVHWQRSADEVEAMDEERER